MNNINHNIEWLTDVCRRMKTSPQNERDEGWNSALDRVIHVIEENMTGGDNETT